LFRSLRARFISRLILIEIGLKHAKMTYSPTANTCNDFLPQSTSFSFTLLAKRVRSEINELQTPLIPGIIPYRIIVPKIADTRQVHYYS